METTSTRCRNSPITRRAILPISSIRGTSRASRILQTRPVRTRRISAVRRRAQGGRRQADRAADKITAFNKAVAATKTRAVQVNFNIGGTLTIREITDQIKAQIDNLEFDHRGWFGRGSQDSGRYLQEVHHSGSTPDRRSRHSQKRGNATILTLRHQLQLATGDDPLGLGRGLARSLVDTKKLTPQIRDSILNQLGAMPPAARKIAFETMEHMIDQMSKKRPELRRYGRLAEICCGREIWRHARPVRKSRDHYGCSDSLDFLEPESGSNAGLRLARQDRQSGAHEFGRRQY